MTALEQLRPRRAEQQHPASRREQRDVLDEVEERLLAPVNVLEQANEWRLLLEKLAERPRDLLAARPRLRLPQERRDRRSRRGIGRPRAELGDDLDDRPVGDPLAIGQTAPADHPRTEPRERLRRQPRLADAGFRDDRDQLAALLGTRTVPGCLDLVELPLATHEYVTVRALGRVTHPHQPEC